MFKDPLHLFETSSPKTKSLARTESQTAGADLDKFLEDFAPTSTSDRLQKRLRRDKLIESVGPPPFPHSGLGNEDVPTPEMAHTALTLQPLVVKGELRSICNLLEEHFEDVSRSFQRVSLFIEIY